MIERELGGRLAGRLDCGCYVYDVAGAVYVVGDPCELDHYEAAHRLIDSEGEVVSQREIDVAAGGAACRVCGCTDNDACEEGCYWVEADLCSSCAGERP